VPPDMAKWYPMDMHVAIILRFGAPIGVLSEHSEQVYRSTPRTVHHSMGTSRLFPHCPIAALSTFCVRSDGRVPGGSA